mgnify:FL=1
MMLTPWIVGIALFLFPGYALLVLLAPCKNWDFVERLCAASGLSIIVAPFLLYGSTYIGTKLTPLSLVIILLLMACVCIWDWWRRVIAWRRAEKKATPLGSWLLLGIFVLTLGTRIWIVRDVTYPLWTDSYHHTIITELIADLGKIPSSYRPYVPVDYFTYHFGFHTLSAYFHWLSGIPVPRSVVLVGQILNALVVPTGYVLIRRLFEKRSTGVIAALVTGLLSHMPTFFVNWGRYPQLTGQILLPVLMAFTLDVVNGEKPCKRKLLLLGIGIAGLFLVHIRVFLFYCMFAALVFIFQWVALWRSHQSARMRSLFLKPVYLGVIMLIVLLPWLWRFLQGYGAAVIQEVQQGYQPQRDYFYFRWQTQYLTDLGMRLDLLLLAGLGIVWGFFKHEKRVYLIFAWVCMLFCAANSYLLNITPLISNVIVIIALYLPCAVLIDYVVTELAYVIRNLVQTRLALRRFLRHATAIAFVGLCVWGMIYQTKLLAPENNFVYAEDMQAMHWIQANIPDDALFYVSVHFWTPIVAHGLDAGYWLSYLTGRETIMPSEVYSSDGNPEYIAFINNRARDLLEAETPEALWQIMAKYGVTHVYIGYRKTYLNSDFLLGAPEYFEPLYALHGVWIFELKHAAP